jgi:hypothetical protein
LAVKSQEFEPCHLGCVFDVRALAVQFFGTARRDGDVACEAHGGVTVREFLLAARDGVRLAPAPRRLDEAHASPKIAVCDVSGTRRLNLADRPQRRGRLHGHADRANHLSMQEQRRKEGGADIDARPACDPVGGMEGAVRSVQAP